MINNDVLRSIRYMLDLSDNNLSKAAKLLDVNRTTLYSKIERLRERKESVDS